MNFCRQKLKITIVDLYSVPIKKVGQNKFATSEFLHLPLVQLHGLISSADIVLSVVSQFSQHLLSSRKSQGAEIFIFTHLHLLDFLTSIYLVEKSMAKFKFPAFDQRSKLPQGTCMGGCKISGIC